MSSISDIPDALQSFVAIITGNSDAKVTFQVFPEQKGSTAPAKVFHGGVKERYATLKKLNDEGAGIFLMVNEGNFNGRKTENAIKVRALFADFDGADHKASLEILTPHMVVESSPGKFHVYWLVNDCPLQDFSRLQKAIARRFGSDPSVHDLARVMRLPGFMHQKSDNQFLVRIVEKKDHPAYDKATITKSLGLLLSEGHDKSRVGPNCQDVSNGTAWEVADKTTGEIVNLKNWAMECPDFLIVDALRANNPEALLRTTNNGKQHIRCPFHSEHTDTTDDNATFCMNGTASDTAGFVIKCLHAHCLERDRLDFIAKMLELGWLTLESITEQRLLAERHRPIWLHYPLDDLHRSDAYRSLEKSEQAVFLHYREICWTMGDGRLEDNSWKLARLLGMDEDTWSQHRKTFIGLGLLHVDNGYLVHEPSMKIYRESQRKYERAVRSGRRGGKSKQSG